MTIAITVLYTEYMRVLPATMKPTLSVLLLLCGVTLSLAWGPRRAVVRAQSASTSGTATSSGIATQSGSAVASSSGIGGVGGTTLPEELPATGSNDLLISLAMGAFLVLSGLIGRATLVHVLREPDEL